MKRAGKKKVKKHIDPVNKVIQFTLKDYDEHKRDLQLEATQKTGILYLVKLSEMGFNEDQIVEVFEDIMKYVEYLDDHIVQMREVQDIIEKHTGIKLNYGW